MSGSTHPELDFCDSASATSSTLVVTPFSARQLDAKPIVLNNMNTSFKPPLRLQLPSTFHPSMPQLQSSAGKGPIEPHVSNLPRRKPRHRIVAKPSVRIPSSVTSLSSVSNRTNVAASPSRSHSPPASSSSQQAPKAYIIDDELTPSLAGNLKPLIPTAPSLELSHALPPSKGHIQPHITNMPRRRLKPIKTQTLPEQRREREKEVWEKARCLQEVMKGSGVWVAFWDWEKESHGSDDEEDQVVDEASLIDQVLHAERVIRILSGTQEQDELELGASKVRGEVLNLLIPREAVRSRDDGVPHLSLEQISLAQDLIFQRSRSSSPAVILESPTRNDSSSSIPSTPTTLSTPSLSRSSSPSIPPLSHSSSPYPSTPSLETNLILDKQVLITVPSHEYAVDALVLALLASGDVPTFRETMTEIPAVPPPSSSSSLTLEMLIHLHDREDLGSHWRGTLSCDGVEWVDQFVLRQTRSQVDDTVAST